MEKAILLTFLGMGIVTYLPRALPLLGLSRLNLPRLFLVWLSMVPAAVLAALTAQSLFIVRDSRAEPNMLFIAISIPCFLVAIKTRSMLYVVLLGIILVLSFRLAGGILK